MICHRCGIPLTGGTDTFGNIHEPLCQSGWWVFVECTPKFITEVVRFLDPTGTVVEVRIRRVRVFGESEAEYERTD